MSQSLYKTGDGLWVDEFVNDCSFNSEERTCDMIVSVPVHRLHLLNSQNFW